MSFDYHAPRAMRDLVLSHFPDACCVDGGGPQRYRIKLWPECGLTIAEAPTKRRAWEAAAEIVKRDVLAAQ